MLSNWQRSVEFSSVAQLCPTLCHPMDCIMPGLPVHHQLLEPTQTHVHWVSDAIQPSHHLTPPSPGLSFDLGPTLNAGCFPDGSDGKESAYQYRTPGFDPWIGKIPWRRLWLHTPLFLPREFCGQRGPCQATVQGVARESDMTEATQQARTVSLLPVVFI